ncbi:MAG: hypothetical protein IJV82_01315 [Oscillospiraceae bacterium]|nr:hypothetical protein [Oscillospiraceae bacterium]
MKLTIVLSFPSYILLAVGLYTMAKRRGIRKPWLAWVPLANLWVLGCLSDQYQYLMQGKQKSRRRLLPILSVIVHVMLCFLLIAALILFVDLLGAIIDSAFKEAFGPWASDEPRERLGESVRTLLVAMFLAPVWMVLAIWMVVLQYMAYYDVFRSADPRNASLYLTLGIVLNFLGTGLLLAIFVFVCRNKDFGMPPRNDEFIPPPPVWVPPAAPYR